MRDADYAQLTDGGPPAAIEFSPDAAGPQFGAAPGWDSLGFTFSLSRTILLTRMLPKNPITRIRDTKRPQRCHWNDCIHSVPPRVPTAKHAPATPPNPIKAIAPLASF